MPSDDLPDWLAKDYAPQHFSAWDEELQAYTVLPKIHPQTGQPLPGEDEREDWPLGIVTADGHWLLLPQKGAVLAYVSGGHIYVQFPELESGAGRPSGLMDLNGLWVIAPSAGYKDLLALTPFVVQVRSPHAGERNELRSLPAMELLQANIIDASWQPNDNTLRADRGADMREQTLVMDEHGKALFVSPYEQVTEFDPKTGFAVAAIRVPFTESDGNQSSRASEGVIHISGTQIIPCEYELIDRSFLSSPPKVHPGGKLLAFSYERQPRVYSTAGELLSAPDVYCTPHHRKVKKGELLALIGKGAEAEIVMFSMKDFSLTHTGQTWRDYLNA
ncbi:hypothetical protein KUF54_17055 [Comamonas sp. Y33R10-2]|uniref:hypothetical protein n=1 Tax=Comamonas sp. Y33R10-2 TaxID=2853257 RepID=UPI001C5C86C2|nr:hypothetical protein [Comamonas sp. Y33R10-2]QXZ09679.1 hypothetical protein KUF54_17055 [Comamonas sp. Y33R10-2]